MLLTELSTEGKLFKICVSPWLCKESTYICIHLKSRETVNGNDFPCQNVTLLPLEYGLIVLHRADSKRNVITWELIFKIGLFLIVQYDYGCLRLARNS